MSANVEIGDRSNEPQEFRLINFPSGSAEPLSDHRQFISGDLKNKILGPDSTVELTGFASKLGFQAGGDKEKNLKLSEDRINKVKQLLLIAKPGLSIAKPVAVGDQGYQAGPKLRRNGCS